MHKITYASADPSTWIRVQLCTRSPDHRFTPSRRQAPFVPMCTQAFLTLTTDCLFNLSYRYDGSSFPYAQMNSFTQSHAHLCQRSHVHGCTHSRHF